MMKQQPNSSVLPFSNRAFLSIVVAALAFTCFSPSLFGDFVFDDTEAIVGNDDVKPEVPVAKLFQNDFWGTRLSSKTSHKSYRPLTVLTFRWNYWLSGGMHPRGFHLTNVILHSLTCLLLLAVLEAFAGRAMGKEQGVETAHLAVLLFTVHPIHSESVAGIVGRADLLSALCYLFALYAYNLACKKGNKDEEGRPTSFSKLGLGLCALFCGLAMLFKEQGITAAGVCFFYDFFVICKEDVKNIRSAFKNSKWLSSFLKRQFVMAVGIALPLGLRFYAMAGPPTFQPVDNPASFSNSTLTRLATYNYLYAVNAWLLLSPWWLCFDWSMGCINLVESLADIRILLILVFWTALGSLIWTGISHQDKAVRRIVCLGLAFLIIPFLPASNLFFRVGFVIAERNLYLPSIGFCLIVSSGVVRLRKHTSWKQSGTLAFYCLLGLFAARSLERSAVWRTETDLFESGLRVCPLNAKVHYNVGKLKSESGQENAAAVAHYREAVRLHPKYDQAWNNLGNLLKDLGNPEEAELCLHRALDANREFAAAWMNLGIVKAALNKPKEAENCYKTAVLHRRKYPDAYYNLGNLYIELNQIKEAAAAFQNATALKVTHVNSWTNLALLYENNDKLGVAEVVLAEGLRHNPGNIALVSGMANVLAKLGRYDDSEPFYKQAIDMNPGLGSLHGNLAVMYHRAGKLKEAEREYKRSLQLEPENGLMKENLGKLVHQISKKTQKN